MKTPMLDGIAKSARFLELDDVEAALHPGPGSMYLSGNDRMMAEQLIERERGKRLGLRHPVLTGIPTLGLWPAASKASALEKIKRDLLRDNESLRGSWNIERDKQHQREVEERRLQIESDRANAARNTLLAATPLLASAMNEYGQRRRDSTGPYGRGAGPGGGRSDGSGLTEEE